MSVLEELWEEGTSQEVGEEMKKMGVRVCQVCGWQGWDGDRCQQCRSWWRGFGVDGCQKDLCECLCDGHSGKCKQPE